LINFLLGLRVFPKFVIVLV